MRICRTDIKPDHSVRVRVLHVCRFSSLRSNSSDPGHNPDTGCGLTRTAILWLLCFWRRFALYACRSTSSSCCCCCCRCCCE